MKQRKHPIGLPKFFITLLGILLLSLSCSDKKKNDEDLNSAFQLHKEAIKVRQNVQDLITQLNSNQDSVFLEKNGASIKAIDLALAEWDKQLIEVPGFDEEHDHSHHDHSGHDHDHDHDHDHGHQPELTSKQHLEVQQQLLVNIKKLEEKIKAIKE